MQFQSKQHLPPTQWEEFEELCLDIFRAVHGDPTAQRHGRRGQAQHGVDVYGYFPDSRRIWAVQAKGKDGHYGASVTESELRDEVEKAKRFKPAISHFTLATTAPRDAKIQAAARAITDDHDSRGLFEVHVAGWEDLLSHIARYDEVIEKHYPDQGPIAARLEAKVDQLPGQLEDILRSVLNETLGPPKGTSADPLNAKVDLARDSIIAGQPRSALNILTMLEQKEWDSASPRLKFRIIANQGSAFHAMGDAGKASELFCKAVEHDPSHEKADLFQGIGLLLNDQEEEAASLFRSQLQKEPSNEGAIEGLILASINDESVHDPLALLPPDAEPTAAILAAAGRFYRQRGLRQKALDALRDASGIEPSTHTTIEIACLLMEPSVASAEARHGRVLTIDEAASLDEAQALFEGVLHSLDGVERPRELVIVAANLAAIYRFKGLEAEALKIIDLALSSAPDDPQLVMHKAVQLAVSGRRADALRALDKLQSSDPEIRSFRGDLLAAEGRIEEALTVLRGVAAVDDPRWSPMAKADIPVLLFRSGAHQEAETEARRTIDADPTSYSGYTALVEIQRRLGRKETAAEVARSGIAAIPADDVLGRIHLADALFRLDEWNSVSDLLLPLATGSYDTPVLRQLTTALYNSDRRADLKKLLDGLSSNVASIEFFLRVKAGFLERIGDLEGARKALEACLSVRPEDLSLRIHWLQCLEELGDKKGIDAFLDALPEFPEASVRELAGLSHLLDHFERGEEATRFAYKLLRKNPSDPLAHRAFIGLMLFGRNARAAIRDVQEVQDDVAVKLTQDGSNPQIIIIETGEDPDRTRGEVAPGSETGQRLLGGRVGATVELLGNGLRSDQWKVAELLPKEIYAVRSSIERFNQMFPEEQGFLRINTDPENMNPAIEEMASLTSARGEHVKQAAGMYQEMPFPLAVLARFVGSSVIDTWLGIAHKLDSPIQVAAGNHEERERAVEQVRRRKVLVIDPLTLFILHDLEVVQQLIGAFGPFGITRSSLTLLEHFQRDREQTAGQELTIAEAPEGRLSLYTFSPEATRRAYDRATDVLRLARKQQIIQAAPREDPPESMREVASFMGAAFLDTILAAKAGDGTLVSEDLRLREWSDEYLGGQSTWIQPLLIVALEKGALTRSEYAECLVKLLRYGHTFVSLDSDSLTTIAKRTTRRQRSDFDLLLERLSPDTIEIQSLTGVLGKFLSDLWSGNAGIKIKVMLTRPCSRILAQRWNKSKLLLDSLRRHVLPKQANRGARRSFDRALREFWK